MMFVVFQYMHFPQFWNFAEFQPPTVAAKAAVARVLAPEETLTATRETAGSCRDVTWPGRFIARELFFAQLTSLKSTGSFQSDADALMPHCLGIDSTNKTGFGWGMCNEAVSFFTATFGRKRAGVERLVTRHATFSSLALPGRPRRPRW